MRTSGRTKDTTRNTQRYRRTMRFPSNILITAAAISVTLGLGMTAQTEPLQLSFQEALEIAQADNPQVRLAKLNIEKAKAQIGEAYAGAMPSITASGYFQRNIVIPEMVVEMPPGFNGGTVTMQFEQDNLFTAGVELSQPLYLAGKVGLGLKIAKLYKQATQEQLAQTRSELKLMITQLYFGAAVAQEWEKVVHETYSQMQAHLATVDEMHREGLVSEYDLIRSRVQASNFYPQVIGAQTVRKVAFEALSIALDQPKDREIVLTDHLGDYPFEIVELEDPFGLAIKQRSELKQVDLQHQMLGKLLKVERHGIWWPNVFLVGGYSATTQEPEFDFENYYWMESLYGGISVSIPIFDGFRAHHRAQQVKVDLKLLDLQRDQLIRGINLEIIQAQDRLNEALKNVEAQVEGRELAEKGLAIAEVRYENGLATQIEVMDAQVALNQAKTNELTARYDAITAQAELLKAVGRE